MKMKTGLWLAIGALVLFFLGIAAGVVGETTGSYDMGLTALYVLWSGALVVVVISVAMDVIEVTRATRRGPR